MYVSNGNLVIKSDDVPFGVRTFDVNFILADFEFREKSINQEDWTPKISSILPSEDGKPAQSSPWEKVCTLIILSMYL